MEENALYDEIRDKSQRFQQQPFNLDISRDPSNRVQTHLSVNVIGPLVCASYAGAENSPSDAYPNQVEAAIANYVALVGSYFDSNNSNWLKEDGAMTSGGKTRGKGRTIGGVADGVSKTALISESKEEVYGAWIDGQSMWATATSFHTPTQLDGTFDSQGLPNWNPQPASALNYGPDANDNLADATVYYYPDFGPSQTADGHRAWGPSSEHAGGVVTVTFGDGHTSSLPSSTDVKIVMALTTATGGESFDAANF
jgi:hypothetical protein